MVNPRLFVESNFELHLIAGFLRVQIQRLSSSYFF
jgi:hypothetical protein